MSFRSGRTAAARGLDHSPGGTRFGSRAALIAALLLAAAAVTMTMTACAPVALRPTTPGGGAGGAEPPATPTPPPDPTPQETERTWTLDAAAFGDDGGSIWTETSNGGTGIGRLRPAGQPVLGAPDAVRQAAPDSDHGVS